MRRGGGVREFGGRQGVFEERRDQRTKKIARFERRLFINSPSAHLTLTNHGIDLFSAETGCKLLLSRLIGDNEASMQRPYLYAQIMGRYSRHSLGPCF